MTPFVPNRRSRSQSRRAFTLIELLVVIGIIALLVTISLFVVNKARRSASAARVKSDFVAISTAIDQFKADHKAFPGMVSNLPPGVDKHNALAYCLISPAPAALDGGEGPGFRVQPGSSNTKLWPAYLDSSKFKTRETQVAGETIWQLLDAYDTPIVYAPRRRTAVRPGFTPKAVLLGDTEKEPAMLDVRDVSVILSTEAQNGLLMALGDSGDAGERCNNRIDSGETLQFQGDYVLMSAGADGQFFTTAGPKPTDAEEAEFHKADDVFNFDR